MRDNIMKRNISKLLYFLFLILFISGCSFTIFRHKTTNSAPPGYNIDDLNNYGEWVNINIYGAAWRPYVVRDWTPFDHGHWRYINGYWTWVSYEPFGWIVYHYGNWYYDPYYEWVWIPSDKVWSPANVIWIHYGNYISWAPFPPHGANYGHPWDMNNRRYWHVVQNKHFTNDDLRNYYVKDVNADGRVTRNFTSRAPDREMIEKSTGRPVTEIRSQRSRTEKSNRNLERMDLPQPERKNVEQNSERIKKDVLVPRDKSQRDRNENKRDKKDNGRRN